MTSGALNSEHSTNLDVSEFKYWIAVYPYLISHFCQHYYLGFPGSSAGKETPYNAGDHSSIPGSRRSAGEGIGYSLQYSWASLVAQMIKNPPAMQESWVQSLGWEEGRSPGGGMATSSIILAWRIPMDGRGWLITVHGVAKSWKWLSD